MAILKEGLDFTGSIGNMTAYKMKGSNKTILRRKGGPSKDMIRNDPKFEGTRQLNSEFRGCAQAVKNIREALWTVRPLADHNFTPFLTEICVYIQQQDKESSKGRRNVYLSRHRELLEGFRLNNQHKFSDVVAGAVHCVIDREKGAASIRLPALLPGLNLKIPWKQPLFRLQFSLAMITDVVFNTEHNEYALPPQAVLTELLTAWHIKEAPFETQELTLQLNTPPADHHTLILAAGLEMGIPLSHNFVNTAKYAGCAEILRVG